MPPQADASAKSAGDGPGDAEARQIPQRPDFAATAPVVEADAPAPPFSGNGRIDGAQSEFRRDSALSRTKKTSPSRTLSRPPPQRSIFAAHHMQAATEDALRRAAVTRARSQARQPFLHRNFGHASVLSTNANKCKVKSFTKADFAKAKKIGIMPP